MYPINVVEIRIKKTLEVKTMKISEKIKEMQGDLDKYHVTEKKEEECKLEDMIIWALERSLAKPMNTWISCFIKEKDLPFLSA